MRPNINKFVIRDINEEQWYTGIYGTYPNFVTSIGYAKKYKYLLIAKIRALLLGKCIVETCF